ncbi:MAG: adenylate/guanylate cyclase domain-containing protein [Deltaproteobacteria bacterium]|nr:adenylate/guanylate cyclase domain-containing protein [Deltaproteobacteria bacterium]
METPKTQLATLFADISGSTRLYETLGDAVARRYVSECLQLLMDVTGQHGGNVVKTIGDEVMVTLPDADSGGRAASAMQEAITARAVMERVPLAIRIGFHYGPVIAEGGDVYGDAVNVASRIAGLAKGSQILTSRQTVEAMAPALQAKTRMIDQASVKGKQESIDIYEVIWREDDLTQMEAVVRPHPVTETRLSLSYLDTEIEMGPGRLSAVLGRGQGNDLVIADEFASRQHARVESRRGKFVLTDQSTNGTFVLTHEGKHVRLHREELLLQETGMISLGRVVDSQAPTVIRFRLFTGTAR